MKQALGRDRSGDISDTENRLYIIPKHHSKHTLERYSDVEAARAR